jgi:hypothetical protein
VVGHSGDLWAPGSGGARVVCIGHSHSEVVKAAAEAAGAPVEVYNFWHLKDPLVTEGGVVRLAPWLAERMRAPVFSLIGGAVHHDIGLVEHPRAWDVVVPEYAGLPVAEGAEIVPYGAVRANILERLQPYFGIMDAVREVVEGEVFQLQSPPIYAGDVVPGDDPGWDGYHGAGRRMSPAWLRWKLRWIQSELIEARCGERGIGYVGCPSEAVDAEGFMRAGYAGSPGHANAAYGALLLGQIRELTGSGATGPSGVQGQSPWPSSSGV